jgi:hypothetical protein
MADSYAKLADDTGYDAGGNSVKRVDVLDVNLMLKSGITVIYSISLFIFFIESVIFSIYTAYLLVKGGFSTNRTIEADIYGTSTVLLLFLSVTMGFVFFAGIKARNKLTKINQERFAAFLKVFTELLVLLLIFFSIGFASNIDLGDNVLSKEELLLGFGGVHVIFFTLVLLKANKMKDILKKVEKNQISSRSASFASTL